MYIHIYICGRFVRLRGMRAPRPQKVLQALQDTIQSLLVTCLTGERFGAFQKMAGL